MIEYFTILCSFISTSKCNVSVIYAYTATQSQTYAYTYTYTYSVTHTVTHTVMTNTYDVTAPRGF